MTISINIDGLMRARGINGNDLADAIGISPINLSRTRTGKVKAVRFSTLEGMCEALGCQPSDILFYTPDDKGGVCTEEASIPSKDAHQQKHYYTVREAKAELGLTSRYKIYHLLQEGTLEGHLNSNQWFITKESVQSLIKAQETK